MDKIEQKDIPGFPGYKAGADGNIYSQKVRTDSRHPNVIPPLRMLNNNIRKTGKYFFIALRKNGKTFPKDVHRIICIAFNGSPMRGQEASHLNGNRFDNRPENLIWETRSENHKRRIAHGTDDCGIRNSRAMFNAKQIIHIRECISNGSKLRVIAKEMKCDEREIGKIKRGERYVRT